MPTKRRRRTRQFTAPVSDAMRAYLRLGELPSKSDPDLGGSWFEVFTKSAPESRDNSASALREDWLTVRDEIMADWIQAAPGTRPWAWWHFDAPRWQGPFAGRCADLAPVLRKTAEPRRRLGGIGTPSHEVLNVWPSYRTGVPRFWVTTFDEEFYNGRRLDVHGRRIGQEYADGHFSGLAPRPDDPPIFESEAAYLDRHGLLPSGERKRLTRAAFAPLTLKLGDVCE